MNCAEQQNFALNRRTNVPLRPCFDVQDSGIPFHYVSMGENFKFEETKILERVKNSFKIKILESIHISNKSTPC